MKVTYSPYRHDRTVLYLKVDLNKKLGYLHFCLFGRGLEVWIYEADSGGFGQLP